MDRKYFNILSDIKNINNDINNLKSEQPFGYDTTELKLFENNNQYDMTAIIPASSRRSFKIVYSGFGTGNFAYNQVLFQIWVGNMSTPYYGKSSGLGVFTPESTILPILPIPDATIFETINSTGSPITIFIKGYSISSYKVGFIDVSGA